MKITVKQFIFLAALVLGVTLVGTMLGLWWGNRPNTAGFSIGAPTEPIARMAYVDTSRIIVLSANGNYYSCQSISFSKQVACWELTTPPSEDSVAGSDYSPIDATKFAPPPGKIRELRSDSFTADISGTIQVTRYALLEDGTVWVWQAQAHQYLNPSKSWDQVLGAGIGLCCGGAVGLLLALLLGAFFWYMARQKSP